MNGTFLKAAWNQKTKYIPVWYMRQAGRYLPEYKKLKEKYTILQICKNPKIASLVTLMPVKKLNTDAAILFSDITIPLIGIGVDLDIVENVGPVIKKPIRTLKDAAGLAILNPKKDIPYLLETIKIIKQEFKQVPLIGFSAGPFTLASYLIEGKPTRDFITTKSFMYNNQPSWKALMESLTKLIIVYLQAQIKEGADAIQVFDTWAGYLSETDYKEFVLPYTKEIFNQLLNKKVPLIHFATNTGGILKSLSEINCQTIGIDWKISIDKAREIIGPKKSIQGNLDPATLLAGFPFIKRRVDQIFSTLTTTRGYIFNLGHGVLPSTPVENLIKLTEYVHRYKI